MRYDIFFPGRLPNLNEIIALHATARNIKSTRRGVYRISKYDEEKKVVQARLEKVILESNIPPIGVKVDVEVIWYEPNRRRDPDNITAGLKFILDALVSSGILRNDGWSNIGSISHFFKKAVRVQAIGQFVILKLVGEK